MQRICLAGITGWTGKGIGLAVLRSNEFTLASAVAKRSAGSDVGTKLGLQSNGIKICATIEEALQEPVDVLIDYTHPEIVKHNTLTAIKKGIPVVIGTSGLTDTDYAEIEVEANKKSVGVIAAGNFSLTAALAKRFALMAAKYLPQWEIIDYCQADKVDAPSGTTRELAAHLAKVKANRVVVPIDQVIGMKEARGAELASSRIHSVRLPGFVSSFETIFGLPHERLSIRHDSGSGAEPYVDGTLLAVKSVPHVKGLIRGLDTLLFDQPQIQERESACC